MPKQISMHECSLCGFRYEDKEDAERCETAHHKILCADPVHEVGLVYPDRVVVTFENNKKVIYKRDD